MLKTNSKAAKNKIAQYILDHFQPYDEDTTTTQYNFSDINDVCLYIWDKFIDIEYASPSQRRFYGFSVQTAFDNWLRGLPSILNPSYLYSCPDAVTTVGDILEQTAEERNKYTEQQAENLMNYMIYKFIRDKVAKSGADMRLF